MIKIPIRPYKNVLFEFIWIKIQLKLKTPHFAITRWDLSIGGRV